MKPLGRHVLVEMYGCDVKVLNDFERVQEILTNAAKKAKASIIDVVFHKFSPQGVSGVIVIAESHLAIHTWPEYGYAAVDLFTCGDEIDPWVAERYIASEFRAVNITSIEMKRGILNIPMHRILQESCERSVVNG